MSGPDTTSPTFAQVMGDRAYRAVYLANALSGMGDYLARAAVTVLVYDRTHSPALSAASFAISFLPSAVAGPLLAAVAERYSARLVMGTCAVARAVVIVGVAVTGVPIPLILGLLFVTALLNPPFEAARSALLPRILG